MRKHNLLVCDDEEMIRNQVCRCASETGLFNVFVADSADKALEVLASNVIDGMILDVRMPNRSGIDLLKEMKIMKCAPVVYMLSGHDEPEYIRQSVHYGVAEYLLKPLTTEEIQQNLISLEENIENRLRYQNAVAQYKNQIDTVLPILKNQFLKDLLQCNLTEVAIKDTEKYLRLRIIYPFMRVAVADIEDGAEDSNPLINYAVGEMVSSVETESLHTNIFHSDNRTTVIIFGAEGSDRLHNISNDLERALIGAVQSGSATIRIGIGETISDYINLRESYSQALRALETADLREPIAIVDIGSLVVGTGEQRSQRIHSLVRKISDINELTDNVTFSKELNAVFGIIKKSSFAIDELIYCCTLIVAIAINRMDNDLAVLSKNPIMTLASKSSPDEIVRTTEEMLAELSSRLHEESNQRKKKQVDICKQIIEKDYPKKIGVSEIAEQMKFSSSYLSTIFKNETGYSINEYLTAYRLQVAKKLLRDSELKIYEIAEEIGIPDMYYFSNVFKKNIGVSPSEYRNNH